MGVKKDFTVRSIPKEQTYEWLLKKHYAHRIPSISYAFGLYDKDNILQGVCTFGSPPRCFNNGYAAFDNYSVKTLELNRLIVGDVVNNSLSYFVSQAIKILPRPALIISYADPNNGHHGYIYQATNWLYTGIHEDYIVKFIDNYGNEIHARTVVGRYGTADRKIVEEEYGIKSYKQTSKHRYFIFLGNHSEKTKMMEHFKLPILPYPKGDNKRYDASYNPQVQGVML